MINNLLVKIYLEKLLDTRSLKVAFVFFVIPYFFFFIGYLDDKFNINHKKSPLNPKNNF